jgi:hypothetical protein
LQRDYYVDVQRVTPSMNHNIRRENHWKCYKQHSAENKRLQSVLDRFHGNNIRQSIT